MIIARLSAASLFFAFAAAAQAQTAPATHEPVFAPIGKMVTTYRPMGQGAARPVVCHPHTEKSLACASYAIRTGNDDAQLQSSADAGDVPLQP